MDMPNLQHTAPAYIGNYAGRPMVYMAVHWLSGGLADYNSGSANLSDVQANDGAYHCSPARSPGEKDVPSSFRSKLIARNQHRLSLLGAVWLFVIALFPRRSSGRERTRMAGIRLSRFLKRAFLTLSIYSRWERPKSFAPKKFF